MINLHRAALVLLWVWVFVPSELRAVNQVGAPALAESITPALDGTGTIVTPQGNQLNIQGGTQAGNNLFHSFERFNLTSDQIANFISNPTIQTILGRVVGGDASIVNGLIQVTGGHSNLFLINPAGIIFGSTAQLNVPASFHATTATAIEFGHQHWLDAIGSNNYASLTDAPTSLSFLTHNSGVIFNTGNLSVGEGQTLALSGGIVMNTGTLSAPGGTITISAIPNERIVRLTPQGSLLSLDVPIGDIEKSATRSTTEKSLPELLTGGALSNATGVITENGVIQLTPSSPAIPLDRGTAIVSGTLSVTSPHTPPTSSHPPTIQVFGDNIALLNAKLSASTPTGGGSVLVGGDYQGKGSLPHSQFIFADPQTFIDANALRSGLGGTVVLWSDNTTRFHGTISAQGDLGGQVETSGKHNLDVTGAAVRAGNWLLDPSDINIVTGGAGSLLSGVFSSPTAAGTIDPTTIAAALDHGTNVTITTAGESAGHGDITLTSSLTQTGGGTASLTLTGRRFIRPSNALINLTSTGDLTFNLNQISPESNAPSHSIQNAIDSIGNVSGNRTINLGAGTYSGQPLTLDRSVNLQGAPSAILSGDGTSRVLEVGGNVTATLRHLTLTNGQTAGSGGGIFVSGAGSNLTIENSHISGNHAVYGGGISSPTASTVNIFNSTISGNSATQAGGGIESTFGATLNVSNSTIARNTAQFGGGISLLQNHGATIADSMISDNTVPWSGGGIFNDQSTLTITGTNIFNNTAGIHGGGIQNFGVLNIENTKISYNTANLSGGGIKNDVVMVAKGIDVSNNNAGADGGGIYNQATLVLSDSTISDNSATIGAGQGGGLANNDASSELSISRTNFTNNRAHRGGAIHIFGDRFVNIRDSLISGNVATTGEGGGILSVGNNLYITGTTLSNNQAATIGGGMLAFGTTAIENTNILQNYAAIDGGGLYLTNATTIINSNISNNQSKISGGGIRNYEGGNLTIKDSTVSNNHTIVRGGGINNNGQLQVLNSTLSHNAAEGDIGSHGGAIENTGTNASAFITESRILNNRSNVGGGIDNTIHQSITVNNSLIEGNTANHTGGGVNNHGNITLTNSTLSENAANQGGAVFNAALLNSTNVTISGNSADHGGGVYNNNGDIVIQSNTLTNNHAIDGGGIFNAAGIIRLQNTIVAANRNTISSETSPVVSPDVLGLFADRGNNLIGIDTGSTGFTTSTLVGTAAKPIDPRLAALADNGGSTPTHALLPGSPAINAGNNSVATPFDQRGVTRIRGGAIDIGAFESEEHSPVPPTPPTPVPPTPILPTPTPSPSPTPIPPMPLPPTPTPPSPSPLPSPTPSLGRINPKDFTNSNQPNLATKPPTETPGSMSIVTNLDQSLSNDYEQYYGLNNVQKLTLQDIGATLNRVQQKKNIRSVIVYAIFTPQTVPPAPKSGEHYQDLVEPITPFLRSKLKRDDDRLDLVMVTATGEAIRYSTTATRAQVTQQAKLFRLAVSDVDDDKGYVVLAKQLYSWLLQPLENELKQQQITSLIYCVDEGLRTIPIAAISAERNVNGTADQQDYAINRYTISVIPSVSLVNREITNLHDRTLLAMGADRFSSLDPLPAVPTELQLVTEQFWKGKHFLNQEFTLEQLLRQKQIENPGIVHLATHAQFNVGAPSQSYIQLWNSRIKLSQMASLGWANPPLELLVLSACDTAIGSTDAELGFSGLATVAGVRSVMGSLWTVSDIGTLALMSEFYIQLQTAPTRSEALRRAQLALRNGTVRIENGRLITSQKSVALPAKIVPRTGTITFTHPFYWSAFTLVGNPW